ncbi:MAG: short-chain dehydrogenase [Actinobacteria bacterium]|nr:short-chain dehydrogenase [Actinomycetota bacterium]
MTDILLTNRVIIVTGASKGLGLIMARAFIARGAFVVATGSKNSAELAAVQTEFGDRAICISSDVTNPDNAASLIDQTIKKWGKIDVLVNNAGLGMRAISENFNTRPTKFWESDIDAWRKIVDTNVNGPFYLSHFVIPHMLKDNYGKIINISTSYQTMVRRGYSPYGASKAFLEAATRSWANELKETGITVNVLLPGGATDTDLLPPSKNKKGADGNLLAPSIMIEPALWLASNYSDGITGARFIARFWDRLDPNKARTETKAEPNIM